MTDPGLCLGTLRPSGPRSRGRQALVVLAALHVPHFVVQGPSGRDMALVWRFKEFPDAPILAGSVGQHARYTPCG